MGIEIERKFKIKNDSWKKEADSGTWISQGYLNTAPERTVRVRIRGESAYLTIKGKNQNLSRKEFEYQIPVDEAKSLLELCESPIIEKTRYLLQQENLTWEIDIFGGVNQGLQVAEVELESEQQSIELPDWIGEEVSNDVRYYNSSLIANPYSTWDL